MPIERENIMCKDKAKDTLAILFANGQISFDSFRDAINHLTRPKIDMSEAEYDLQFMKMDGREG